MMGTPGMSEKLNKIADFDTGKSGQADVPAVPLHLLLIGSLFLAMPCIAQGQVGATVHSANSTMRQHYDAAFRFQSEGDMSHANAEYKLFLSMALHRIANGHANLGEYGGAAPIYEEALRLAPDDHSLLLDYAGAALDASDWTRAKALATSALSSPNGGVQTTDPRALSFLAQALLRLGEHQEALEQFKALVRLYPGFESSSSLATAYLVIGDKTNGTKILGEFPQRFGDTASLHMKLGIIYGKTNFFDAAIAEFSKAIKEDARLKGAHYSLGASYMMLSGKSGYDNADLEFHKEIELDPANSLVYLPLGRIALIRNKYAEAEADLKRAIELNPRTAATYIVLGQVYRETDRVPQAIVALRKAIALTLDPSKNGYEVEQAHYWLGRLLIQSGKSVEGRKELDISQNLIYLKERELQSKLAGKVVLETPLEKTHEANPADLAEEKSFERQAAPVIASSYDNLGVNAANAGIFGDASNYFAQAAKWNPKLDGVDRNWSRAAIAARQYAQAVTPLKRMFALDPKNVDVRAMLGLSLCMTHDYARSLELLRPIEAKVDANPELSMAYAASMAMAGDSSQGLVRLKTLKEAHPDAAIVYYLLGQAYAAKQEFGQSADELRTALELDPTNADAEKALAISDFALGQKADALRLFAELAGSGSKDGEVYDRLAQLQLEAGSTGAAIASLETAIRIDPADPSYHAELAEAYLKNSQPEDADREALQSEKLRAQSESSRQAGSGNAQTGNHSGDPGKLPER
jgi:tetratricopeptide (TPR) repeat protein